MDRIKHARIRRGEIILRNQRNKTMATRIFSDILRDKYLYMMLVPVFLIAYIMIRYIPMYGVIIAFKNFRFIDGILGSQWVGFSQFQRLFRSPDFLLILRNTLLLNIYQLIFGFPAPILLAILLNEVKNKAFKRSVQSFLYVPHFISWVVMGGIFIAVLSPSTGFVNLDRKSVV